MIAEGARITLATSGGEYVVGGELGAGAQGAVFRVTPVGGGPELALKWYRRFAASPQQAARLGRVVRFPRPSRQFLWPIDLVRQADEAGYGYVMPLRSPTMESLARLMHGPMSMRLAELCTAAAQLADAFLRLHSEGLCYADISAYNVFVDPASGAVEVCDNDNVCIDGEVPDVLGTPMFMAPEVLRGQSSPSAATDRHSLAVILFMMFVRSHPLHGVREAESPVLDADSQTRLLADEPVFVFDPRDDSNRPVPDLHTNALLLWPMLPGFVRRLFTTAFTDGLREPLHSRVPENVWRTAMLRLRGLVRCCPACGAEQFLDEEAADAPCADPACRAPMPTPALLQARHTVVLDPGATVRRSDLVRNALDDDRIVGDVVAHPTTGAPALRNRSGSPWTLVRPTGRTEIGPRAAFVLRDDEGLLLEGVEVRIRT